MIIRGTNTNHFFQIMLAIGVLMLPEACVKAPKNGNQSTLSSDTNAAAPVEGSAVNAEMSALLEQEVSQLLKNSCASCHNATTPGGGLASVELEDLKEDRIFVTPGDAEASLLYTSMIAPGGNMPPKGLLAKEQADKVGAWIKQLKVTDVSSPMKEDKGFTYIKQKCAGCHNPKNPLGGFDSADDEQKMIDSGRYIVPGQPDLSVVYSSLAPQGNMPPSQSVSEEDRKLVRDWIISLASTPREPITDAALLSWMRQDLEKNVPAAQRTTTRYFSFQNVYNRGLPDKKIAILNLAFNKTLNSLSQAKEIILPTAVGEKGVLVRVNLNDIRMNRNNFENMVSSFYPFIETFNTAASDPTSAAAAADHNFLRQATGSQSYIIRADWFVATATLPVPYQRLLNLPNTVQSLENRLGIDAFRNIRDNAVIRSGFKRSNVSTQNRIVERHVSESTGLSYWLSYDFSAEDDDQNIFNNPLGPVGIGFENRAFVQDGGEVIFQLPNGMLGYYLLNGAGNSIDRGPQTVVRKEDGPKRLQSNIVNGFSCMSCHGRGFLVQDDQIREFAQASNNFSQSEKDKVNKLYSDRATFRKAIDDDNRPYFAALKKMNIDPFQPDVAQLGFGYYQQDLSSEDVMKELQIDPKQLDQLLTRQPFASRWVALKTPGGRVNREEFNLFYGRAINDTHENKRSVLPFQGDYIPNPTCLAPADLLMNTCINDLSQ